MLRYLLNREHSRHTAVLDCSLLIKYGKDHRQSIPGNAHGCRELLRLSLLLKGLCELLLPFRDSWFCRGGPDSLSACWLSVLEGSICCCALLVLVLFVEVSLTSRRSPWFYGAPAT